MCRSSLPLCALVAGAFACSPASAGTISGDVIVYGSPQGGQFIEVFAFSDPSGPPDGSVVIDVAGGPYTLNVPDGGYSVAVVFDRDGLTQEPAVDDIVVWYDSNIDGEPDVLNAGQFSNIDVNIGYVYVDVDAAGANDGSSWADAYTDLNTAIMNAQVGVETWVADGTYLPGDQRTSRFLMKSGVRIYGGFAGRETLRTQRDVEDNVTILSCEIGDPGTATDNCYHVVDAAGSAGPSWRATLLDGVTITGGYANGPFPDDAGGGVFVRNGGMMIANAVIRDNFAQSSGGGLVQVFGFAPVYNTLFLNNRSQFAGGGYRAGLNGQPLFGCVFTANSSFRGGAIALDGGSFAPVVGSLTVYGNQASGEGPGLWVNNPFNVNFAINNSIFWGNTGGTGAQATAWVLAPSIDYSIVQGGYTGGGTQLLTDDPLFIDPDGPDDVLGTPDDDLVVEENSPAVDAGTNGGVPLDFADLDGNHVTDETISVDFGGKFPRFADMPGVPDTGSGTPPIIDIGAFEIAPEELIFLSGFEAGEGAGG